LDVVDREEHALSAGEVGDHAAKRETDRAAIGRGAAGLGAEERDVERVSLRLGQDGKDVVDDPVEDVSQRRERELRLRAGRTRGEDAIAALGRGLDAGAPERRLADARLSLEQQPSRARLGAVDEGSYQREFVVPADDRHAIQHQAAAVFGATVGS
jgi:hypothetical protein